MSNSISLRSIIEPGISKRDDFVIRVHSMALLVIDIQNELSKIDETNNGYKHSISLPRMITNTRKLVNEVRALRDNGKGGEVVFTYLEAKTNNSRDISIDYKLSGLLANLPNPTSPAKFIEGVSPVAGEDICVPKTSCSVFQSTNLDYILRNMNIEQLVICGQLTDQCVQSAVRDAADMGYLVTVVEDACGANSEEEHKIGLHGMKGYSRIITTDDVLREIGLDASSNGVDDGSLLLCRSRKKKSRVTPTATEPAPFVISSPSSFVVNRDVGNQPAILRCLSAAGVKFIRYTVIDAYNTIRAKAVPLSNTMRLLDNDKNSETARFPMDSSVSIAEVCFAGLPSHADALVASSNLSARNVLTLQPDISSVRVLPYSPKTAMIMCTAHDQLTQELSPLCTRGLLERVLYRAKEDMGLAFSVGAELEFMLYHTGTDGLLQPVDMSTFANTTILNEQEDFISMLHDQLEQQYIPVEMIHAESAPGQLEVVLAHSHDVLQLADNVVFARETIINCAKQHGMKPMFLPKMSAVQAGNGLHLHFSFRDVFSNGSENVFADPTRSTGMSPRGESFVEGILNELPSLLCVSMPTNNSFRRMGPGCWTGHEVGWSIEHKEAPLRVCIDLKTRKVTNVEYKLSDAMANIYLELAMILSSGLKGIKIGSKLRPMIGDASVTGEDYVQVDPMPQSLQSSLDMLKKNEYLLSILGTELSTAYIAVRESESLCTNSLEEEVGDALKKA